MATTWRREPVEIEHAKHPLAIEMHRMAGRLGFSGMAKKSAIDGRWFMEVQRHVLNDDGSYRHTYFNIVLGTGDTPLEAVADGYSAVAPRMRHYPVLVGLELVVQSLNARARAEKKLDATLDGLTDTLRSLSVPRPAAPGEDDDL